MSRYRRSLAVALAVTAALAVSGCGTGRHPQILDIKNTVNGAQADLAHSTIQVRDAYVTPPVAGQDLVAAGQRVTLHAYVFNTGSAPDTLTAVTAGATATTLSPAAGITVPPNNFIVIGTPAEHTTSAVTWNVAAPVLVGTNLTVRLEFGTAGTVDLTVPVEYTATSVG